MDKKYGKKPVGEAVICCDCGKEFIITDGEKAFYEEKGFTLPKRCKNCRNARKAQRENGKNSK